MDFKDVILSLSERAAKLKDSLSTEETTKTALVFPFIQALGYDIFNPTEVVPEYTCDVGTKNGERINGAIQELKTIGRGYRNTENFRIAILFFHGNLDLISHKSQ